MSLEITSQNNPRLRAIRRLLDSNRYRRQTKLFVVEGSRWMKEVIAAGLPPDYWLATTGWLRDNDALAADLTRLARPPLMIAEDLLRKTADTQSPAGVIAVLPQPAIPWPAEPTFLLMLDQLRDPGNVGTLLRSAAAAGVEGALFTPKTVDPFNPKVVRSSMGAILRLPLREPDWAEIPTLLAGCVLMVADSGASQTYTAYDWRQPAALLIGGEARGASAAGWRLATGSVSIPMHEATESLNAAIAGSIILFEVVRQRRS